ncbi:hypothetical protein KIN_02400 [Litoreibacter roseus]|uniref:Transposase IS110-like N-terminal domain-containing protein n=2 Tax=Litoreibacter roseus TaxID=2601869 RepID=A0A6N6JAL1_9RHOB|nr:hypothetical protein KIN_02400 [Litoreibacter roseus]
MLATYVKLYVKRGKTDTADAEAICEAARRPTMRFVEIGSEDQQAVLAIHRARDLVVRQRTQVVNMIRSILREFGHILRTGIEAKSKFVGEHGQEVRPDHLGATAETRRVPAADRVIPPRNARRLM